VVATQNTVVVFFVNFVLQMCDGINKLRPYFCDELSKKCCSLLTINHSTCFSTISEKQN